MHDVLALEEDISEDAEANAGVVLDAAEAGRRAVGDGRIVDVLSGHNLVDAADDGGKRGQSGRAGEHVSTVCGGVGGPCDFGVVGFDDGGGEVQQRGAGVANGVDGGLHDSSGADCVSSRGELPEAVGGVNVDVGQGSGVLGRVDEAEVVGTGSVVLERDAEHRGSERAVDGVKPRLGLVGLHGVDAAEGKAKQTVGVAVRCERARDRGCGLNGLGSCSHAANDDLVSVDSASSTRSIAIADLPGCACNLLRGVDFVVVVAGQLGRRLEGREGPAMK